MDQDRQNWHNWKCTACDRPWVGPEDEADNEGCPFCKIKRLETIVAAGSHLSEAVSMYLRAHDQHGHSRHIDMDITNKAYSEATAAGGE